jgi:hypothetical protein
MKEFKLSKDILQDAQNLDALQMNLEQNPVIEKLETKFLGFGSCFAQNLQRLLEPFSFPFYFNRSICAFYSTPPLRQTLEWLVEDRIHTEEELYFFDNTQSDISSYRHFRLRNYGKDALSRTITEINELDKELRQEISDSDVFIVTLGTALNGYMKKNGFAICSFFGVPQDEAFYKIISPQEVSQDLNEIYKSILKLRNNKPFELFITISPQRYNWTSTVSGMPPLMENFLSKSTLRVGINEFINQKKLKSVHYFPSFEMVIDELRLYESLSIYDHLHINQEGTPKYVVKRFLQLYCSSAVLDSLPLYEDLRRANDLTSARTRAGADIGSKHLKFAWESIFNRIHELSNTVCTDSFVAIAKEHLRKFEGGEELIEMMLKKIIRP